MMHDDPTTVNPPTTTSPATQYTALLRDAIVARVHAMSSEELLRLSEDLNAIRDETALADWEREHLADAPSGARVIRYGPERIRLTTDPPEMPPYGPKLTPERWRAIVERNERDLREGRGVPARQFLETLRSRRS